MATKKISDYSAVVTPANSDLLLQDNGSNYNNISLDQLSEFVQRDSDYADVIETRTSDYDYTAADLEPDHRIFVNVTAGNITLGFFNGSSRDGAIVILQVVGTGTNKCYLELVASGTTSNTLEIGDTIILIWDDTNSVWKILLDRNNLKKFESESSSLTVFQNKKYFVDGLQLDLTLPDDGVNAGDIIEVFTNNPCNIIQGDAENAISYLNKYFTTKGTSGYLNLRSKNFLKMMYQGSGNNRVEPGVKLTNPSTLPTGNGNGCYFSPDNTYLAVAHDTSPYITIYKRSGDTFTKLSDPATLPPDHAHFCAFSPDNTYLAVAHDESPYITIYKRSGDTFTKLADPATLPTGVPIFTGATSCDFSPDNTYLAVGHAASPFITIYKRSGDTFTKLTNPSSLPTTTSYGCVFSKDNAFLAVPYVNSPYIIIYKRSGDTFTKLADPATLPTGNSYGCSFSQDNNLLAVVHDTSPYITIYKRDGDIFIKLSDPATLPAGKGENCNFSPDNTYLAVAHGTSPYITIYKRSGDTFTKLADPATLPTGGGTGCNFSPDNTYLAVAHGTSPYITIYKNVEAASKVWQVLQLNSIYPDQLEFQFK